MNSDDLYRLCDFLPTDDLLWLKKVARNFYHIINKYLKNKRSLIAKWDHTHQSLLKSNYKTYNNPLICPIFLKDIGLLCEFRLIDQCLTLKMQSYLGCKKIVQFMVLCKNTFTIDNIESWKMAILKNDESYLFILGNFKDVGQTAEAIMIDFSNINDIGVKSYYYTDGLFSSCTQWESRCIKSPHHEISRFDELIIRCKHHKNATIQRCISIKYYSQHSLFWNMNHQYYFFMTDAGFTIVDMVNVTQQKLKIKSCVKKDIRCCNSCHFWNPVEKSLNIITHGLTNRYFSIMKYHKTWKVIYRSDNFPYRFGTFCTLSLSNAFFPDSSNSTILTSYKFMQRLEPKFLKLDEKNVEQWVGVRCALIPWTFFHNLREKYPGKKMHKIQKRDLTTVELFLNDKGELDVKEHNSLFHHPNTNVIKLKELLDSPPVVLVDKKYLTTF